MYAAFVLDVYSRMIVGWQVATSMYSDLGLDALQVSVWRRDGQGADVDELVHHSDRGKQTGLSATANALPTPAPWRRSGPQVTAYDNAMAEASNSLYKAELVRNRDPWRGLDDLEPATVEYIDWYNNRRLYGELGHIPPTEHQALHAMTRPLTAILETR